MRAKKKNSRRNYQVFNLDSFGIKNIIPTK